MAKQKGMKWWDYLAIILLIVGGLNWGLVGLWNYNLVTVLFGTGLMSKVVYTSVFVSAVYSSLWLGFGKK